MKRITVVFRKFEYAFDWFQNYKGFFFSHFPLLIIHFSPGGTVTETNNWEHNKKVKFSKMETPKKLIDLGFKSDKPIQVHTGFKSKCCIIDS